eukprot:g10543.t1
MPCGTTAPQPEVLAEELANLKLRIPELLLLDLTRGSAEDEVIAEMLDDNSLSRSELGRCGYHVESPDDLRPVAEQVQHELLQQQSLVQIAAVNNDNGRAPADGDDDFYTPKQWTEDSVADGGNFLYMASQCPTVSPDSFGEYSQRMGNIIEAEREAERQVQVQDNTKEFEVKAQQEINDLGDFTRVWVSVKRGPDLFVPKGAALFLIVGDAPSQEDDNKRGRRRKYDAIYSDGEEVKGGFYVDKRDWERLCGQYGQLIRVNGGFLPAEVTFRRQLEALLRLRFHPGRDLLLNVSVAKAELIAPDIDEFRGLDEMQKQAAACVAAEVDGHRYFTAQGPPGAGKTHTVNAGLKGQVQLARRGERRSARHLLVSTNNAASQAYVALVNKSGDAAVIAVLHLTADAARIKAQKLSACDSMRYLDTLAKDNNGTGLQWALAAKWRAADGRFFRARSKHAKTPNRDNEQAMRDAAKEEGKLKSKAELVLQTLSDALTCTCSTSSRIQAEIDGTIVIDEREQAPEAETNIPASISSEEGVNIVAVGDTEQLKVYGKVADYAVSYAQRYRAMVSDAGEHVRLTRVRRSDDAIVKLFQFKYPGLVSGGPAADAPLFEHPVVFIDCPRAEKESKYQSAVELEGVMDLLKRQFKPGNGDTAALSVAVITPYSIQRGAIKAAVTEAQTQKEVREGVEVQTVDAAQGKEFDVIVASFANHAVTDHLVDRRVLTLLSRARLQVFVFADRAQFGTGKTTSPAAESGDQFEIVKQLSERSDWIKPADFKAQLDSYGKLKRPAAEGFRESQECIAIQEHLLVKRLRVCETGKLSGKDDPKLIFRPNAFGTERALMLDNGAGDVPDVPGVLGRAVIKVGAGTGDRVVVGQAANNVKAALAAYDGAACYIRIGPQDSTDTGEHNTMYVPLKPADDGATMQPQTVSDLMERVWKRVYRRGADDVPLRVIIVDSGKSLEPWQPVILRTLLAVLTGTCPIFLRTQLSQHFFSRGNNRRTDDFWDDLVAADKFRTQRHAREVRAKHQLDAKPQPGETMYDVSLHTGAMDTFCAVGDDDKLELLEVNADNNWDEYLYRWVFTIMARLDKTPLLKSQLAGLSIRRRVKQLVDFGTMYRRLYSRGGHLLLQDPVLRKLRQIEQAVQTIVNGDLIRVYNETTFCSVRTIENRDADVDFKLTSQAGAGKVLQHLVHTEDPGNLALIALAYALRIRLGDCCSGNNVGNRVESMIGELQAYAKATEEEQFMAWANCTVRATTIKPVFADDKGVCKPGTICSSEYVGDKATDPVNVFLLSHMPARAQVYHEHSSYQYFEWTSRSGKSETTDTSDDRLIRQAYFASALGKGLAEKLIGQVGAALVAVGRASGELTQENAVVRDNAGSVASEPVPLTDTEKDYLRTVIKRGEELGGDDAPIYPDEPFKTGSDQEIFNGPSLAHEEVREAATALAERLERDETIRNHPALPGTKMLALLEPGQRVRMRNVVVPQEAEEPVPLPPRSGKEKVFTTPAKTTGTVDPTGEPAAAAGTDSEQPIGKPDAAVEPAEPPAGAGDNEYCVALMQRIDEWIAVRQLTFLEVEEAITKHQRYLTHATLEKWQEDHPSAKVFSRTFATSSADDGQVRPWLFRLDMLPVGPIAIMQHAKRGHCYGPVRVIGVDIPVMATAEEDALHSLLSLAVRGGEDRALALYPKSGNDRERDRAFWPHTGRSQKLFPTALGITAREFFPDDDRECPLHWALDLVGYRMVIVAVEPRDGRTAPRCKVRVSGCAVQGFNLMDTTICRGVRLARMQCGKVSNAATLEKIAQTVAVHNQRTERNLWPRIADCDVSDEARDADQHFNHLQWRPAEWTIVGEDSNPEHQAAMSAMEIGGADVCVIGLAGLECALHDDRKLPREQKPLQHMFLGSELRLFGNLQVKPNRADDVTARIKYAAEEGAPLQNTHTSCIFGDTDEAVGGVAINVDLADAETTKNFSLNRPRGIAQVVLTDMALFPIFHIHCAPLNIQNENDWHVDVAVAMGLFTDQLQFVEDYIVVGHVPVGSRQDISDECPQTELARHRYDILLSKGQLVDVYRELHGAERTLASRSSECWGNCRADHVWATRKAALSIRAITYEELIPSSATDGPNVVEHHRPHVPPATWSFPMKIWFDLATYEAAVTTFPQRLADFEKHFSGQLHEAPHNAYLSRTIFRRTPASGDPLPAERSGERAKHAWANSTPDCPESARQLTQTETDPVFTQTHKKSGSTVATVSQDTSEDWVATFKAGVSDIDWQARVSKEEYVQQVQQQARGDHGGEVICIPAGAARGSDQCVKWAAEQPKHVYIGRGTLWGNRHRINEKFGRTRTQVVVEYIRELLEDDQRTQKLGDLRGHVLACHCMPKICHGHVLLDLVQQARLAKERQTALTGDGGQGGTMNCLNNDARTREIDSPIWTPEKETVNNKPSEGTTSTSPAVKPKSPAEKQPGSPPSVRGDILKPEEPEPGDAGAAGGTSTSRKIEAGGGVEMGASADGGDGLMASVTDDDDRERQLAEKVLRDDKHANDHPSAILSCGHVKVEYIVGEVDDQRHVEVGPDERQPVMVLRFGRAGQQPQVKATASTGVADAPSEDRDLARFRGERNAGRDGRMGNEFWIRFAQEAPASLDLRIDYTQSLDAARDHTQLLKEIQQLVTAARDGKPTQKTQAQSLIGKIRVLYIHAGDEDTRTSLQAEFGDEYHLADDDCLADMRRVKRELEKRHDLSPDEQYTINVLTSADTEPTAEAETEAAASHLINRIKVNERDHDQLRDTLSFLANNQTPGIPTGEEALGDDFVARAHAKSSDSGSGGFNLMCGDCEVLTQRSAAGTKGVMAARPIPGLSRLVEEGSLMCDSYYDLLTRDVLEATVREGEGLLNTELADDDINICNMMEARPNYIPGADHEALERMADEDQEVDDLRNQDPKAVARLVLNVHRRLRCGHWWWVWRKMRRRRRDRNGMALSKRYIRRTVGLCPHCPGTEGSRKLPRNEDPHEPLDQNRPSYEVSIDGFTYDFSQATATMQVVTKDTPPKTRLRIVAATQGKPEIQFADDIGLREGVQKVIKNADEGLHTRLKISDTEGVNALPELEGLKCARTGQPHEQNALPRGKPETLGEANTLIRFARYMLDLTCDTCTGRRLTPQQRVMIANEQLQMLWKYGVDVRDCGPEAVDGFELLRPDNQVGLQCSRLLRSRRVGTLLRKKSFMRGSFLLRLDKHVTKRVIWNDVLHKNRTRHGRLVGTLGQVAFVHSAGCTFNVAVTDISLRKLVPRRPAALDLYENAMQPLIADVVGTWKCTLLEFPIGGDGEVRLPAGFTMDPHLSAPTKKQVDHFLQHARMVKAQTQAWVDFFTKRMVRYTRERRPDVIVQRREIGGVNPERFSAWAAISTHRQLHIYTLVDDQQNPAGGKSFDGSDGKMLFWTRLSPKTGVLEVELWYQHKAPHEDLNVPQQHIDPDSQFQGEDMAEPEDGDVEKIERESAKPRPITHSPANEHAAVAMMTDQPSSSAHATALAADRRRLTRDARPVDIGIQQELIDFSQRFLAHERKSEEGGEQLPVHGEFCALPGEEQQVGEGEGELSPHSREVERDMLEHQRDAQGLEMQKTSSPGRLISGGGRAIAEVLARAISAFTSYACYHTATHRTHSLLTCPLHHRVVLVNNDHGEVVLTRDAVMAAVAGPDDEDRVRQTQQLFTFKPRRYSVGEDNEWLIAGATADVMYAYLGITQQATNHGAEMMRCSFQGKAAEFRDRVRDVNACATARPAKLETVQPQIPEPDNLSEQTQGARTAAEQLLRRSVADRKEVGADVDWSAVAALCRYDDEAGVRAAADAIVTCSDKLAEAQVTHKAVVNALFNRLPEQADFATARNDDGLCGEIERHRLPSEDGRDESAFTAPKDDPDRIRNCDEIEDSASYRLLHLKHDRFYVKPLGPDETPQTFKPAGRKRRQSMGDTGNTMTVQTTRSRRKAYLHRGTVYINDLTSRHMCCVSDYGAAVLLALRHKARHPDVSGRVFPQVNGSATQNGIRDEAPIVFIVQFATEDLFTHECGFTEPLMVYWFRAWKSSTPFCFGCASMMQYRMRRPDPFDPFLTFTLYDENGMEKVVRTSSAIEQGRFSGRCIKAHLQALRVDGNSGCFNLMVDANEVSHEGADAEQSITATPTKVAQLPSDAPLRRVIAEERSARKHEKTLDREPHVADPELDSPRSLEDSIVVTSTESHAVWSQAGVRQLQTGEGVELVVNVTAPPGATVSLQFSKNKDNDFWRLQTASSQLPLAVVPVSQQIRFHLICYAARPRELCLPLIDVWLVNDEAAERQVAAQTTLAEVAEFLPECHRPEETKEEFKARLANEEAEIAEAARRFAQEGIGALAPAAKVTAKAKPKARTKKADVATDAGSETTGTTAVPGDGNFCKIEAQGGNLEPDDGRAAGLLRGFERWGHAASAAPDRNCENGPSAGTGRWSVRGIGKRYVGVVEQLRRTFGFVSQRAAAGASTSGCEPMLHMNDDTTETVSSTEKLLDASQSLAAAQELFVALDDDPATEQAQGSDEQWELREVDDDGGFQDALEGTVEDDEFRQAVEKAELREDIKEVAANKRILRESRIGGGTGLTLGMCSTDQLQETTVWTRRGLLCDPGDSIHALARYKRVNSQEIEENEGCVAEEKNKDDVENAKWKAARTVAPPESKKWRDTVAGYLLAHQHGEFFFAFLMSVAVWVTAVGPTLVGWGYCDSGEEVSTPKRSGGPVPLLDPKLPEPAKPPDSSEKDTPSRAQKQRLRRWKQQRERDAAEQCLRDGEPTEDDRSQTNAARPEVEMSTEEFLQGKTLFDIAVYIMLLICGVLADVYFAAHHAEGHPIPTLISGLLGLEIFDLTKAPTAHQKLLPLRGLHLRRVLLLLRREVATGLMEILNTAERQSTTIRFACNVFRAIRKDTSIGRLVIDLRPINLMCRLIALPPVAAYVAFQCLYDQHFYVEMDVAKAFNCLRYSVLVQAYMGIQCLILILIAVRGQLGLKTMPALWGQRTGPKFMMAVIAAVMEEWFHGELRTAVWKAIASREGQVVVDPPEPIAPKRLQTTHDGKCTTTETQRDRDAAAIDPVAATDDYLHGGDDDEGGHFFDDPDDDYVQSSPEKDTPDAKAQIQEQQTVDDTADLLPYTYQETPLHTDDLAFGATKWFSIVLQFVIIMSMFLVLGIKSSARKLKFGAIACVSLGYKFVRGVRVADDSKICNVLAWDLTGLKSPSELASVLGLMNYISTAWGVHYHRIVATLTPWLRVPSDEFKKKFYRDAAVINALRDIHLYMSNVATAAIPYDDIRAGRRVLLVFVDSNPLGTAFVVVSIAVERLRELTPANVFANAQHFAVHMIDSSVFPSALRWLCALEVETYGLKRYKTRIDPLLRGLPRTIVVDNKGLLNTYRTIHASSSAALIRWAIEILLWMREPGSTMLYGGAGGQLADMPGRLLKSIRVAQTEYERALAGDVNMLLRKIFPTVKEIEVTRDPTPKVSMRELALAQLKEAAAVSGSCSNGGQHEIKVRDMIREAVEHDRKNYPMHHTPDSDAGPEVDHEH